MYLYNYFEAKRLLSIYFNTQIILGRLGLLIAMRKDHGKIGKRDAIKLN